MSGAAPAETAPPTAREEAARLRSLRRYEILDTPSDGAFDRVASLAARLFAVPVAIVSFVDSDRVWFKAVHGLTGLRQVPRSPGLCASVVRDGRPVVVQDTLADAETAAHPLVAGPPGVRFYAGAPLTTPDGHHIGTVALLDTRPRSFSEEDVATLRDLAQIVEDSLEQRLTAARQVRWEQARRRVEQQARQQAERDKQSLAVLARALQNTLSPPSLPTVPGLELACHYRTASPQEVGGDFYDVFGLGDGRWAFFLGDVCGKGAEAAAVTSLARYALRAAAQVDPDPQTVLGALNTSLLLDARAGSRFCTAVYGTLTPQADGSVNVSLGTGGHPPAYHLARGDGGPARVRGVRPPGGMLIGALPEATFASTELRLAPGESLLLYTDGLTEARTGEGGMLGDHGLVDFLSRRTGALTAAGVVEDTVALLERLPDDSADDVAILALSVPAAAPEAGTTTTARTCAGEETGAPLERDE